jgi:ABC-2 type transport system ATP-binding protein
MLHCDTPNALRKLVPGDLVSIASQEPRKARDSAARVEGVLSVLLVGDGIHVVVDDAARRIPELERALSDSGAPFDRIEKASPSMEDLFVSLVGQAAIEQ